MVVITKNIHDQPDTAAIQQLDELFRANTPYEIEDRLWHLFRLAVQGGLGTGQCVLSPEGIVLLQRQFISLAAAASKAHQTSEIPDDLNTQNGGGHD